MPEHKSGSGSAAAQPKPGTVSKIAPRDRCPIITSQTPILQAPSDRARMQFLARRLHALGQNPFSIFSMNWSAAPICAARSRNMRRFRPSWSMLIAATISWSLLQSAEGGHDHPPLSLPFAKAARREPARRSQSGRWKASCKSTLQNCFTIIAWPRGAGAIFLPAKSATS